MTTDRRRSEKRDQTIRCAERVFGDADDLDTVERRAQQEVAMRAHFRALFEDDKERYRRKWRYEYSAQNGSLNPTLPVRETLAVRGRQGHNPPSVRLPPAPAPTEWPGPRPTDPVQLAEYLAELEELSWTDVCQRAGGRRFVPVRAMQPGKARRHSAWPDPNGEFFGGN